MNLYIRYIIELFTSVAAEKQIKLIYSPGAKQPVIDHDREKLMEVLTNLLSNALKFTQHAGRVEVSTALTGEDRFEIRIADNGPGIQGEHMPYIFDRFYRVEEGGAQSLPGSGLGLALTRELVKLMKGTIRADSVYGQGTTFTVDLPVTRNAPQVEMKELQEHRKRVSIWIPPTGQKFIPPYIRGKASANKPMLLIVEDNADVVQYLFTLLENEYMMWWSHMTGRRGSKLPPNIFLILSSVMW
ncbi:MAG TPA: ATP-binding protein [Bacteroides sp.]|nr:ATP-binding protein [Bacteroides sp.]